MDYLQIAQVSGTILLYQVMQFVLKNDKLRGQRVNLKLIQKLIVENVETALSILKPVCDLFHREEWEWLQTMNADNHAVPPTNSQLDFQKVLATAVQRLFTILGMYMYCSLSENWRQYW